MFLSGIVLLFGLASFLTAEEIPAGTVVPVQLNTGFSAKKDRAGKKLTGRVMQDVPLPNGEKIKAGSRIVGYVKGTPKRALPGSGITVRFESIQDGERAMPLTAAVLAVASAAGVHEAQIPINSAANVDPPSQWVTRQIGGDIVNRGRGKAASETVVGTWVQGNSVIMRLTPNPQAGCPGGVGYDREQAVWIFSSAACGVYDLTGLSPIKIVRSGASSPLGEAELNSDREVSLRAGSGWLLMSLSSR